MNQKLYLVSSNNRRRVPVTLNDASAGEPRPRCRGRIVDLVVGAGHGSIRMADKRDVYFHRGDLLDGTPFNGLKVGDSVVFELLEDRFSGARALHVERGVLR